MKTKIIILPIHPSHVEKILSGEKQYEYRKRIPDNLRFIVVYSTAPISKITALIEVAEVIKDCPDTLWNITHVHGGISKEFFEKYFAKQNLSYAIKIKKVFKIEPEQPICLLGNIRAPQSYIYIDKDIEELKSLLNITGEQ